MTTHTNETSRRIYARVRRLHLPLLHRCRYYQSGSGWRNASDRCAHPAPKLLGPGAWRVLYALTREQEPAIAMLALTCRVVEAVHGEVPGLLRRGQPALLLAVTAWTDDTRRAGLARRDCFGPARRDPASADAGLFGGPTDWSAAVTWLVWLPMLVYEVVLALWLLIQGVGPHQADSSDVKQEIETRQYRSKGI